MALRTHRLLWLCALPLVLMACASSEDGTTAPPEDSGPVDVAADAPTLSDAVPTPTAVETIAPTTVRAGEAISVACRLLDATGATVTPPMGVTPTITFAPATSVREEGGQTLAVRVGTVTATCAFPSLTLTDASPAPIQITPGEAARVTTTLDHMTIMAGDSANATCAVTDAYGNAVTDAHPTLRVDPMGMGSVITGLAAHIERSGMYTAQCTLPGATSEGVSLTVIPAYAASLVISRSPDMPLYARGSTITINATVSDRFGNLVPDAMLSYTSTPAAATMGPRFRYDTEGRYTVAVRVISMTEGSRPLAQTTSFTVDSSGPGIECVGPAHGAMVNAADGETIPFEARLTDATGVRSVRVNGAAVTPGNDGSLRRSITARWGVNFVDVSATDTNGNENSRTCAFLASDRWNGEGAALPNGVQLLLRQDAIDDGDPTAPITSIDDLLQRVLNSAGLRTQLDTTLRAANPIKPNSCDQNVCAFGGCVCLFRSQIDYQGSELNGPNRTTLTLVDGGLRANVHFENVRVRLALSGTLSTSGWVTVASLDVGVVFDLSATGGRPRAAVRAGSVTTSVGRISTDFSGLTGVIVDVVVAVANGTVRNLVSNALRDYVSTNFTRVLDGVLSGLDVTSLGATFNVPRIDGSGATPLRFGVNVSTANATAARLRFGLGTILSTAMPAHARATLGIALPPGDTGDPAVSTPATAAVQVAVLNQALHSLWRGGWLQVALPASRFTMLLPADTRFDVNALLPPVASLRADGHINLDLGAVEVAMTIPGAPPFSISLGARASGTISLMGNTLRFGGITLDELHVSITSESISMSERAALTDGMRMLAQQFVERSLNDALPAIPVPAFTIPASLATYGLPAGAELGLRAPALGATRQRFELRGGFGQR